MRHVLFGQIVGVIIGDGGLGTELFKTSFDIRRHSRKSSFEGRRHQFVLGLKMPVEAALFQPYLLHHGADAAAVTAALAERARRHGKNLLVILRFVLWGIPHQLRVRTYSNVVKANFLTARHSGLSGRRRFLCR